MLIQQEFVENIKDISCYRWNVDGMNYPVMFLGTMYSNAQSLPVIENETIYVRLHDTCIKYTLPCQNGKLNVQS